MNNKLSGTIFILFGIGLLGDSLHDLYYNSINMDFESAKSVFFLLLGISSCIYGYKQITNVNTTKTKDGSSK